MTPHIVGTRYRLRGTHDTFQEILRYHTLARYPGNWSEVVMFKVLRFEARMISYNNDIFQAFSYMGYSEV